MKSWQEQGSTVGAKAHSHFSTKLPRYGELQSSSPTALPPHAMAHSPY